MSGSGSGPWAKRPKFSWLPIGPGFLGLGDVPARMRRRDPLPALVERRQLRLDMAGFRRWQHSFLAGFGEQPTEGDRATGLSANRNRFQSHTAIEIGAVMTDSAGADDSGRGTTVVVEFMGTALPTLVWLEWSNPRLLSLCHPGMGRLVWNGPPPKGAHWGRFFLRILECCACCRP